MISEALRDVMDGGTLERERTRAIFGQCLGGEADPVPLAGLLVALAQRGETADEIAGTALALRDVMQPFAVSDDELAAAVDTCGTGGDGHGTFNISTAAAIVVAAAGGRVIKHGNRAVSSRCGSADLLEHLGVKIDAGPDVARRCLDEAGITFLFAPHYHPAMKHAAPIRRALGVRTIFNLVGPLASPARVRRQVLGVSHKRLIELHAKVLEALGVERALVVHGAGGADELTLAGRNAVEPLGFPAPPRLDAEALGLARAPVSALRGGDAAHNAAKLHALLSGEDRGAIHDAVVLNAAAALLVGGVVRVPEDGVEKARDAIADGAAAATLKRWIAASGGTTS